MKQHKNCKYQILGGCSYGTLYLKNHEKKECGILNLDDTTGSGTHWVAWYKDGKDKYYFDSYGLQPPNELVKYLRSKIFYNTEQVQRSD